jgi:hypothetical protein
MALFFPAIFPKIKNVEFGGGFLIPEPGNIRKSEFFFFLSAFSFSGAVTLARLDKVLKQKTQNYC